MRRFTKAQRLTALGILVALAAAGGAIAYWTGSGGGSGSAGVGTSSTVTVAATVPAGIAPGTSVPVSFTATNASESPIQVTTVQLTGVTADAAHDTCETDDFTMANVAVGHLVPAGATAEPLGTNGSLVYANTTANQDACKGATLTLTLATQ